MAAEIDDRRMSFGNVLFFSLLLWLPVLAPAQEATTGERPQLSEMMHRHDAKLESWSVVTRVRKGRGREQYSVLILSSGSMFGVPGNLVCGSSLERPSNRFRFKADLLVPPFETVDHNREKLEERFDKNILRWDNHAEGLFIESDLWRRARVWLMRPTKPHMLLDDVIRGQSVEKRFDWYLIPRIEGESGASKDNLKWQADGHFQQFWGAPAGQNADWIVAHLDSGHDVMMTRFKPEAENKPWLPGDYLVISYPDGRIELSRDFSVTILEQWTEPGSRPPQNYAVDMQIRAGELDLSMRVKAFRDNQLGKVGGRDLWLGFADVLATVAEQSCSGWAYLSPVPNNPTEPERAD